MSSIRDRQSNLTIDITYMYNAVLYDMIYDHSMYFNSSKFVNLFVILHS